MRPPNNTKPRLLCVDDEPELLDNLRLVLRKRFEVTTASSGAEALALFDDEDSDPFDAIVSDMRMPEMSGARLLTTLRQRHPDVPRILLTGHADLDSAIAAVNEAKIFRFLTKPCPPEELIETIDDAIQHARLRNIERDLLDRTLNATVDLMTDILGLVSSAAADRSRHIRRSVQRICQGLTHPISWELELAAMLSQLGHVALHEHQIDDGRIDDSRVDDSQVDDSQGGEWTALDERHVELAAELLVRIPRLESVAALIRGQLSTEPVRHDEDRDCWTPRELDAEILRLAVHHEHLLAKGRTPQEAFADLMFAASPSPAFLLEAVGALQVTEQDQVAMAVTNRQLLPGMVLAGDLKLTAGPTLAPRSMELTAALIGRVQSFARSAGVREPIDVLVPAALVPQVGAS